MDETACQIMDEDCIEGLDASQEHPIASTGLSPATPDSHCRYLSLISAGIDRIPQPRLHAYELYF